MESIDLFLQQYELKHKTRSEQKKFLRKFLISKRIEQFKHVKDTKAWGENQFFNALKKLNISYPDELQRTFRIACFFPIRGELNLIPFAQSDWLFPKIIGKHLHWFEYGDGKTDYILNTWQIPEKPDHLCFAYTSSEKPLLCFVPGLAGDQQKHRLGYGLGYYDQFLSTNQNVISILCLPSEEFLFDRLPNETHDFQVNLIEYDNNERK